VKLSALVSQGNRTLGVRVGSRR